MRLLQSKVSDAHLLQRWNNALQVDFYAGCTGMQSIRHQLRHKIRGLCSAGPDQAPWQQGGVSHRAILASQIACKSSDASEE